MPPAHTLVHARVTPRSGSDAVFGWQGGSLRVRVTAAPDDGKANRAACKVVASFFGVPKTAVTVTRGAASRNKTLDVVGLDRPDVDRILREHFPDQA